MECRRGDVPLDVRGAPLLGIFLPRGEAERALEEGVVHGARVERDLGGVQEARGLHAGQGPCAADNSRGDSRYVSMPVAYLYIASCNGVMPTCGFP